MLVYAWCKYLRHPRPELGGADRGDISYIRPLNAPVGGGHDGFTPFVIDIDIPCGEKFTFKNGKRQWNCAKCETKDPDLCEMQRLTGPVWSTGTIFEEPKLAIKRKCRIDIDALLSNDSIALIEKENKTIAEQALIRQRAINNPIVKTLVIDKATL